ncbi:carbamoyltransferase HypF [Clostridium cellulovorans]|uniref:Carbamoyltransferase n=1 Tax=Clostridium cellulovorans (strain ATCC 35296 / DSM 3052 / OCM 3 / 743B) TaxID=573061 RepID=D9SV92_CLOC7|nr:carbamoyltransferase HypF [Clostridium cellulovorans]ADL53066.1 (NiFe) hydrogenase maturation protein HypF [Clostridium cellulovorans 743B]
MKTCRYRIKGIVQGVGFRPFIHKITAKYELKGWVLNDSEGVVVEVQGKQRDIDSFIDDVKISCPPMAKIQDIIEIPVSKSQKRYADFIIKRSIQRRETNTFIPPDAYVCKECVDELLDKNNRRYKYPFINCTNCGPRYTIIKEMPYDRISTTMKEFKMCPDCQKEYKDINSRRYHAQPNACPICGPQLELRDKNGEVVIATDVISFSKERLLEGKIFAIKSIGGFHLAANALDEKIVKKLRLLKKRDSKPFAIMVNDTKMAEKYMEVSEEEKKLLNGVERPIVLLKKKPHMLPDAIAPNNPSYGVMLPSAPLHYLLLEDGRLEALIMTSGNISGEPIVYENNEAIKQLNSIADYFILNNRDIYTRVDDSIVRYSNSNSLRKPITSIIRRARGFAPYPIIIDKKVTSIVALGSELKATVATSKCNTVFISQHIGDVKNDKIFESLFNAVEHLKKLLTIEPKVLVCDLHPNFKSSLKAMSQSELPVIKVQHHHAHMAACMAENNLEEDTIGIIFDGTGYGHDGTIWGGEFLVGDYNSVKRVGSLDSFYLLGGDKAIKEPFRVALDILYRTYGEGMLQLGLPFLSKYTEQEMKIYYKMSEKKINAFETTSMGRLFDGVSVLINLCTSIEYEGQAAIELEGLLNRDFTLDKSFNYEILQRDDRYIFDYRAMIREIVNLVSEKEYDISNLSRRFHSTIISALVSITNRIRKDYKINNVVLSGGVFMNEYLLVNSIIALENLNFNVFYHSKVPTNDGGISLGQVMVADAIYNKTKKVRK